jgi:hypothetical protein
MPHILSLLGLFVFAGCAGSSSIVARLPITPRPEVSVQVMPLNPPQRRIVARDWRANTYAPGILPQALGVSNPYDASIYQYTFDEQDYRNLRQSLIESLRAGKYYKAVGDGSIGARDDLLLEFSFVESGIQQTFTYSTCIIKGRLTVKQATGKVLRQADVSVEEKSAVTVGASKNAAIRAFLQKTAGVLSSL